MSLDISVAGTAIPTNSAALKSLQDDLNLAFKLDSGLKSLLASPLDQVPASAAKTSVQYASPDTSWNPSEGPVTFGLQGSVSGALEIVTGGDLVAYTDGLDTQEQKSISVPANTAYVKLTLNFTISASASATYSGGAYGVKGGVDTSTTYAIAFCKAFPPSTQVQTAIAQTFQSFVLPLHEQTLEQLSDGDYLLNEFDGNLHLSFGAYGGLDEVLYAGNSSADVVKTFGSPLATLQAETQPTIKAGATLDFSFQYATKFEALLSKNGTTARLHLFRSSSATTSTTLKGGLTFDANTTASITPHLDTLQSSLTNSAAGGGDTAKGAIGKVLSSAQAVTEINKYADEVNDKLSSWLDRANGLQANLQVAIETSKTRTILAGYDFDTSAANYGDAWKAAVDGDFVKAFETGAVTLDIGSGLEMAYQKKTSFNCNFFNLWSVTSWNEFSSRVSLVYAGNNVFHAVADIGRTTETDAVGTMRSISIYFSASADTTASGQASNMAIDLHIDLTSKGEPKAAAAVATVLSAVGAGPIADEMARSMNAFAVNSNKGTVQLQVTIPSTAYARIHCDPYSGRKPLSSGNANDSVNWVAFSHAADDLNAWPLWQMSTVSPAGLTFLKSFSAWEVLNMAANGDTTPNRVDFGNMTSWPADFPQTDGGSRNMIAYSMRAGQQFMNFCAALNELANPADVDSNGTSWSNVLNLITDAIKNDLGVDFLRPAALAVIRLCLSGTTTVNGPGQAAVPTDHFAVSLSL